LINGFNRWLRDWGLLPDYLRIGGTVAVTAIDLAVRMGCRRVILAGTDLAFGAGAATHAAGAVFGGMPKMPSDLVAVAGNFGESVNTTRQFAGYIEILADYYRERKLVDPELEIVNVTSGGARLGEIVATPPEKIAEMTFPAIDFDFGKYILSTRVNPIAEKDQQRLRASLHDAESQFAVIAEIAAEAEMTFDQASGGRLSESDLARLDQADRRFQECPLAMQLLSQMFQPLCQEAAAAQTFTAHRNLYAQLKDGAAWAARSLHVTAQSLA